MLNSLSALASDIQTLLSLANHGAEKQLCRYACWRRSADRQTRVNETEQHCYIKVKVRWIYIAPSREISQACITHFHLHFRPTACVPLPRKRSPGGATSDWLWRPFNYSLLLIYTIRYDSVYLTCGKKLTDSQVSLLYITNKNVKEEIKNKCVSRTDTNPPFAFQTAFPGGGADFSVSIQEGSKSFIRCL